MRETIVEAKYKIICDNCKKTIKVPSMESYIQMQASFCGEGYNDLDFCSTKCFLDWLSKTEIDKSHYMPNNDINSDYDYTIFMRGHHLAELIKLLKRNEDGKLRDKTTGHKRVSRKA